MVGVGGELDFAPADAASIVHRGCRGGNKLGGNGDPKSKTMEPMALGRIIRQQNGEATVGSYGLASVKGTRPMPPFSRGGSSRAY